jgi:hypothetical protein
MGSHEAQARQPAGHAAGRGDGEDGFEADHPRSGMAEL